MPWTTIENVRFFPGDGAVKWAGHRVPPHLDPEPHEVDKERIEGYALSKSGGASALRRLLGEQLELVGAISQRCPEMNPSQQPLTIASSALRKIGWLKIQLATAFREDQPGIEVVSAIEQFQHNLRPAMSRLYRFLGLTEASFNMLAANALKNGGQESAIAKLILAYRDPRSEVGAFNVSWDDCDIIVDRILTTKPPPVREATISFDVSPYQPTPARMVLELIEPLHLSANDKFYDLGCGLFRVPALVAILTPAKVAGVEIYPALACQGAEVIQHLGLASRATMLQGSIAEVDTSDGTVVFLFAGWTGQPLRTAIERIEMASARRFVRIVAHGKCIYELADHCESHGWEVTKHYGDLMRHGNAAWEFKSSKVKESSNVDSCAACGVGITTKSDHIRPVTTFHPTSPRHRAKRSRFELVTASARQSSAL